MALTTNMLHSLFSYMLIFPKNFHPRLAITDSADKQLNMYRHASIISLDLVSLLVDYSSQLLDNR